MTRPSTPPVRESRCGARLQTVCVSFPQRRVCLFPTDRARIITDSQRTGLCGFLQETNVALMGLALVPFSGAAPTTAPVRLASPIGLRCLVAATLLAATKLGGASLSAPDDFLT